MKKNTVLWLLAAAAVGVGGYLYLNQAQAQAADSQPVTPDPSTDYTGGEHYLPNPNPYPEPVIDVIIQPPTVDDPSYATDWGI